MGRLRIPALERAVARGERLTMLTAYDALTASLLDAAGVDMLLVGDSLGNVTLGYSSTTAVELADMVRATGAVSRGSERALIVADLPFGSFEGSPQQAFESAVQLVRAGATAVKLEGGAERAETLRFLVNSGVPVMAHLGYTPQSEHTLGGPRLQGRGPAGDRLLADAQAAQEAGAFAVLMEMVPAELGKRVTDELEVPTIGIGAGPDCSGQVLVWSDMAGMTDWSPSFAKRFAELGTALTAAATEYAAEVRSGEFPGPANYRTEKEEGRK